MHKIGCMHFTYMFAYIFLMKQLNFLSILWFFFIFGILQESKFCLIWATALWVILTSLERGRKEKRPKAVTGETPKRSEENRPVQLESPASYCQKIWCCSFSCQCHRKPTQSNRNFEFCCSKASLESHPVTKLLLHPPQRKDQKQLTESARKKWNLSFWQQTMWNLALHSTLKQHFLSKPEEAVGVSAMSSWWARGNKQTCKDQSGQEGDLL